MRVGYMTLLQCQIIPFKPIEEGLYTRKKIDTIFIYPFDNINPLLLIQLLVSRISTN